VPIPVPPWVANTFPTAKSMNLALYTTDGTADNPNGIAFNSYRPLLFENLTRTVTIAGPATGTTSVLSSSGSITSCQVIYDTAGYFGSTADLPGLGYYAFTSTIAGSAGDGITSGGWTILAHQIPVKPTGTQTNVGADIVSTAGGTISGSRQAPTNPNDAIPLFIDLANTGTLTWKPAVTVRDSSGSSTTNALNSTDPSGEAGRFYSVWSSVSATTSGIAQFTVGGTYNWTAPQGVSSVTIAGLGAGAGGGAGSTSTSGGGGGGGEYASGSVAVTAGNNYSPIVGTGGTGGVQPGGNGLAGGSSTMSGDAVTITAHGGTSGKGGGPVNNGAGGAGGTGAGGTHFDGGAGASGTATYSGGGGSSAGTGSAGNSANSASGAPAPVGGGPGGPGGSVSISVVQVNGGSSNSTAAAKISFNPLQSGNTIVITSTYAANSIGADPTITLNDGTSIPLDTSVTSGNGDLITGIYHLANVSGGQTSATIKETVGLNISKCGMMIEVSGLGPSPTVDNTGTSASSFGGSFSCSAVMSDTPDFWVAGVGGQNNNVGAFNISVDSGEGWTNTAQQNQSQNGHYNRNRTCYQVANAGTSSITGSFTGNGASSAVVILGLNVAATTPGTSPPTPPGGGGGAGLGAFNGGSGDDGTLTLTWTGSSGGGYGTPQIPAPYTAWGPGTTIGSSNSSGASVNINGPNGITDVCNFLANPPVFRTGAGSAQSIGNASVVNVTFSGVTPTVDSYSGWSGGTYTVQRTGMYLFHGNVAFSANTTGTRQAAATINGTTYWGPGYRATSTGITSATKTQIFSLTAGDTVKLSARQDSGGSLNLDTANQTRFFMVWLNEAGAIPQQYTTPDTTFRWTAGTQGANLPGLFQTHLGNDLNFLCHSPYVMAYQTVAGTSLTVGAYSTIQLDTVSGLIHADTGDNYSGWTTGASNKYTAKQPGWYLMAGEFFAASSAAGSANVVAAILPNTSGGGSPSSSPDQYQSNAATSTASVGGGATVFGLQYMSAGESVTPQILTHYTAAYNTLVGAQNSGQFNSHLEIVWVSE
jgi:hypothetical protein